MLASRLRKDSKLSLKLIVKGKDVFTVKMKGDPWEEELVAYSTTKTNAEVWQRRLGHFNHAIVLNLQN